MAEAKKTKSKKTAAETTANETKTAKVAATKTETTEVPVADERDIIIEKMQKQLAELESRLAAASQPQIIQVAAGDGERVMFLWQAEVADDNMVLFGDGGMYGRIVGKTGSFYVPKNDLSRILDATNRHFLDLRWLIVVSGLNEEEREALGVNYKDGELLDKKAFSKMVELGEEILEIYPALCDAHKEIVAKRFYEAWLNRNPHVRRDIVVGLNRIKANEAFVKIIEGINAEELNS